jgi:hypothetical protein
VVPFNGVMEEGVQGGRPHGGGRRTEGGAWRSGGRSAPARGQWARAGGVRTRRRVVEMGR